MFCNGKSIWLSCRIESVQRSVLRESCLNRPVKKLMIRCLDGPDTTIELDQRTSCASSKGWHLGRNRLPAWQYSSWSPEQPLWHLLDPRWHDQKWQRILVVNIWKRIMAKTRKKAQPCPHGRRSKHVPQVCRSKRVFNEHEQNGTSLSLILYIYLDINTKYQVGQNLSKYTKICINVCIRLLRNWQSGLWKVRCGADVVSRFRL